MKALHLYVRYYQLIFEKRIFWSGNAEVSLLKQTINIKYYPKLRINVNNKSSLILHLYVAHILTFIV